MLVSYACLSYTVWVSFSKIRSAHVGCSSLMSDLLSQKLYTNETALLINIVTTAIKLLRTVMCRITVRKLDYM